MSASGRIGRGERDDGALSEREVAAAQLDHERAIAAIEERKGQRASEIMRDHAIRSGDTKRKNVTALLANELPGRRSRRSASQEIGAGVE